MDFRDHYMVYIHPQVFLVFGLGFCKEVTNRKYVYNRLCLRLVAQRREWPLEALRHTETCLRLMYQYLSVDQAELL
jgi:hypothetical protein